MQASLGKAPEEASVELEEMIKKSGKSDRQLAALIAAISRMSDGKCREFTRAIRTLKRLANDECQPEALQEPQLSPGVAPNDHY